LLHFLFSHAPSSLAIYILSLHDALPIFGSDCGRHSTASMPKEHASSADRRPDAQPTAPRGELLRRRAVGCASGRRSAEDACSFRSEEHTSELQSRSDIVCRLLLEKKKNK